MSPGQALNTAVPSFVVQPPWHLARVAQWAWRLTWARLGTRRRLAPDAHLGSRQREAHSEHDAAPSQHAFVDTQADWQRL